VDEATPVWWPAHTWRGTIALMGLISLLVAWILACTAATLVLFAIVGAAGFHRRAESGHQRSIARWRAKLAATSHPGWWLRLHPDARASLGLGASAALLVAVGVFGAQLQSAGIIPLAH